jgi:eukaryotic-like serine/threonine-protein kinase
MLEPDTQIVPPRGAEPPRGGAELLRAQEAAEPDTVVEAGPRVARSNPGLDVARSNQPLDVARSNQPLDVARSNQPLDVARSNQPLDVARSNQPDPLDVAQSNPRSNSTNDPVLLRRWVGRYELIHRLAHGGMATVYLGRAKGQAGFEKVVAVKVIHPHLADEAEFVAMFLDEARIAARLHHPHVVEILDLGESEGAYFMVMEFIEGENLSALTRALGSERLPIAVTLQILADTLEGLIAAHELRDADGTPYQLVHRDVSPHNILINLDGWAKVGDFGIMKAAGKSSNTKTGELRGKLAYMSPEQARGTHVDLRTDLFAVGVIAWELLTGTRLFASQTEAETLDKVMRCEIPSLEASGVAIDNPHLRDGLQRLLDQALAHDPEARPGSAAIMLAEVKRLLRLVDELTLPSHKEPRAYLGALMARFFRRRVDYARAALRRTGEHPLAGGAEAVAASSREWLVDPTVQVGRPTTGPNPIIDRGPDRTPTGSSGIHAAPIQTGSNPAVTGSGTGTVTIVRPNPVAQWAVWLLLPMLGAGLAIAAMLLFGPGFGGRTPAPTPVEGPGPSPAPADPTEQPTPASLAATEYRPVVQRPTPAGQVRWYFSTSPRGAKILIDGEAQGVLTPTWVYLPIGEEPRDIRIELDGYEPRSLQLPAIHDQTFSETLEPLAPEATKPETQASKRVRKSDKPKPSPSEIAPKPGDTGFLPVPESLRE